jgi:GGDEF domain-containing protein
VAHGGGPDALSGRVAPRGLDLGLVTESSDHTSTPATSKPRRARRFVLPDTHHDERTAERIVAFLDGPAPAGGRPGTVPALVDGPKPPKELDTRADWTAAFRHEASRHLRYGRPASVLLLEIGRTPDARSRDAVAHELAGLIREQARSSDRAVRLGPSSFRLLMPETSARAARHLGDRLEAAFRAAGNGSNHRPGLRYEVAAPVRGGSLEDALGEAERRVAR